MYSRYRGDRKILRVLEKYAAEEGSVYLITHVTFSRISRIRGGRLILQEFLSLLLGKKMIHTPSRIAVFM